MGIIIPDIPSYHLFLSNLQLLLLYGCQVAEQCKEVLHQMPCEQHNKNITATVYKRSYIFRKFHTVPRLIFCVAFIQMNIGAIGKTVWYQNLLSTHGNEKMCNQKVVSMSWIMLYWRKIPFLSRGRKLWAITNMCMLLFICMDGYWSYRQRTHGPNGVV